VLFAITSQEIADAHLPQGLPAWIESSSRTIEVRGDRVGFRETFVWNSDDLVLVATSLEELLPRISIESDGPTVSPYGISQVLNHGFPPLPHTVFEGVSRLGSGDTFTVTNEHDHLTAANSSEYPWLSEFSRQDQVPSTTRLRELIAIAMDDQLTAAGGEGILMLSSGKDSVALAVALSDTGHTNVQCVTYKADPNDTEHIYASELCERLGLEHHTIQLPDDPAVTKAAMVRFFEWSVIPSADQGTIPYAIVVDEAKLESGGIIDGGGNDAYMGHLLSGRGRLKDSLRIRNRSIARLVTNLVPHDSPVNYFARSKAGAVLPNRMFRDRETRRFYADARETEDYWYQLSSDTGDLSMPDFMALSKMRHTEAARSNPKVYLAARSAGLEPLFPFCDEGIADYYFNLPEASKFDRASRTNKILLREMLKEAVDYDPAIVGSNFFGFDGAAFLIGNDDFVRDEVLSCDLWLPAIEPLVDDWLTALPDRPFLFHSLLALFMISGWHNHSVFLKSDTTSP
jgi:hypothetical protein